MKEIELFCDGYKLFEQNRFIETIEIKKIID